jgi:hypothetical protein
LADHHGRLQRQHGGIGRPWQLTGHSLDDELSA